jgi:hypothetical protein
LPPRREIWNVENMKGDIAFAGFVLTADEWQELDSEMRAQLIAVATRRADPWLAPPVLEPLAEGSGPLELEEVTDAELLADEPMFDPMAGIDDVPLTRALDREA